MASRRASWGRWSRRSAAGFTLVEALVAVVLVSIGVVTVFGGLRALTAAQAHAEKADLLQRLAMDKLNEIVATTSDPSTANASGDFTDQGYPDVTWSMEVQQENAENVELVKVTATEGDAEQTVSMLQFIQPETGSGAGGDTTGTGGAAGGGGGGGGTGGGGGQ